VPLHDLAADLILADLILTHCAYLVVGSQAKLIGDAHANVAAQDGSFDGSRACTVM
jgi:hypothetical protein